MEEPDGGECHTLFFFSSFPPGALLLENPLGQNDLKYQSLYHEVAKVFGLRSRRFRLFLNAAMTEGEKISDFYGCCTQS